MSSNTLLPVIYGYHDLHERQRNQVTPLAICPKIMARYEEAAAALWMIAVIPLKVVHSIQQTEQIPNDTPRMGGRKVLLLAIIPVLRIFSLDIFYLIFRRVNANKMNRVVLHSVRPRTVLKEVGFSHTSGRGSTDSGCESSDPWW